MLLDEPTEHLDNDDAEAILRRLLAPSAGFFGSTRTVVVVTHHPAAQGDASLSAGVLRVDFGPVGVH